MPVMPNLPGRGFGGFITVYNVLPEVALRMEEALSKIVRKAAFDVQAAAQAKAPVDTGFLKSSIYTVTDKDSNYSNAGGEGEGEMLPEVPRPPKHTACVAVGANYGVYQEFGTSHMPAQPYLTPAVEQVRPSYEAALLRLEAKMATLHIPTHGGTAGTSGMEVGMGEG